MTFVHRVTTNVCLNALCARALREAGSVTQREEAFEPGQVEARELLEALVARLDEATILVAALHFVDGLTQVSASTRARTSLLARLSVSEQESR